MQTTCSQNTIIVADIQKNIWGCHKDKYVYSLRRVLSYVHAVSSRPVTIIASTSFSSIALCMSPILSCQLRPTTRRKELNYRYTNFIHNFYKPSYCYRPLSGAVASFIYLIRYKSSLYRRKLPNYVTAWLTEHPSNNDCSVGIAVVRE